jgi:hypothetical protein
MHEEYYENTVYKPQYARAPELGDYDVLSDVLPKAHNRKIKVIAFIADNFGKSRPFYELLSEVDIDGNPTGNVNLINPEYRGLLFGMIEDCLRSYDIDGLLWRTERMGPISNILGFDHTGDTGPAVSFDPYTMVRAQDKKIDIDKAIEGFRELKKIADQCNSDNPPLDGRYVTFWRLCLKYPEMLAWEMLWVENLRNTYREIYEFAKSIWPAIDIDIPSRRFDKVNPVYSKCTPESTKNAVKAVFEAGAEGIVLARKYSEMNLMNLAGVGKALREIF